MAVSRPPRPAPQSRACRTLSVAVALIVIATSLALAPGTANASTAADESGLVELHNIARQDQGLAPLVRNAELDAIAREWAQHMADVNTLYHRSDLPAQISSRITADYRWTGENALYFSWPRSGSDSVASTAHQMWMNSAGHRANILRGEYNQIGIAFVEQGGLVWGVANFMWAPLPEVPSGLAFAEERIVETAYSAQEYRSMADAAAYLKLDVATFQRYGAVLMRFLNALAGKKTGVSDEKINVVSEGEAGVASAWRGEEIETLDWVSGFYNIDNAQAQKAGATLLTFLVGLTRLRGK